MKKCITLLLTIAVSSLVNAEEISVPTTLEWASDTFGIAVEEELKDNLGECRVYEGSQEVARATVVDREFQTTLKLTAGEHKLKGVCYSKSQVVPFDSEPRKLKLFESEEVTVVASYDKKPEVLLKMKPYNPRPITVQIDSDKVDPNGVYSIEFLSGEKKSFTLNSDKIFSTYIHDSNPIRQIYDGNSDILIGSFCYITDGREYKSTSMPFLKTCVNEEEISADVKAIAVGNYDLLHTTGLKITTKDAPIRLNVKPGHYELLVKVSSGTRVTVTGKIVHHKLGTESVVNGGIHQENFDGDTSFELDYSEAPEGEDLFLVLKPIEGTSF